MVAFLKPPLFVDHLLIYQDRAPEDTDVHFLLIVADDDRWWWSSSSNDDDDDDGGGGGGGGLNQVVWVNWMEAMRFVSLSPGYPDNGHSHSSRRGQARLQVRKLDCSIVPEWNHRRWRERERGEREREWNHLFQRDYVRPYLNPHQTAVWSFWMHPPLTSMQNVGNDDEAALKGPAPRSNHSILASRFKGGLPGAHLHIYCQRQSLGVAYLTIAHWILYSRSLRSWTEAALGGNVDLHLIGPFGACTSHQLSNSYRSEAAN